MLLDIRQNKGRGELMLSGYTIRAAHESDIKFLQELEETSFPGDRLSSRSFKRFLSSKSALFKVLCDEKETPQGYAIVLCNKGTLLARLYSLAISQKLRGKGAATHLLSNLEEEAIKRGRFYMRLEVRADNEAAISLYKKNGFNKFKEINNYYEDESPALCFEKRLSYHKASKRREIPYYQQSTEFTCGAASLLMAMNFLDPKKEMGQREELQLWREATTIFMTSGHGGCGPRGLALAAFHRGFKVKVFLNMEGPLFAAGVRDSKKKEVIELVYKDFDEQIKETDIEIIDRPLDINSIKELISKNNAVPLTLISTYRLTKNKAPHWVVITEIDDNFVFFHDPQKDLNIYPHATDQMHIPLLHSDFEKMAKFGSSQLRASLVIYK